MRPFRLTTNFASRADAPREVSTVSGSTLFGLRHERIRSVVAPLWMALPENCFVANNQCDRSFRRDLAAVWVAKSLIM